MQLINKVPWYKRKENKGKIRCYRKKYNRKYKKKIKQQRKKYNEEHREEIKRQWKRYYNEHNIERKQCVRRYKQQHKHEINRRARLLYQSNETYATIHRLRAMLTFALRHYTKTGKILKSKEYGIDYNAIIKHLGPCPGKSEDYHIHHIKALVHFNLEDKEQVKQAFAPKNLKWLTAEENMRIGCRTEEPGGETI